MSFSSDSPTTTATFSTTGTYVLTLQASDGHYTRSDTVSITIEPPPSTGGNGGGAGSTLPTISFTPGVKTFDVTGYTGKIGGTTMIAGTAHPVASAPDSKDAYVIYPDANENE